MTPEDWRYRLVWGDEELELPPGEVTLGRSRSCDVSVAEPSVSRRHAFLRAEGGEVVLQDLGSSNGTFVDGGRVRGTIRLGDGAELRLGDARLRLEVRRLGEGEEPIVSRPARTPEPPPDSGAPPREIPETERETSQLREGGSPSGAFSGPGAAAAASGASPAGPGRAHAGPDEAGASRQLRGAAPETAATSSRPESPPDPERETTRAMTAVPSPSGSPRWVGILALLGAALLGSVLLIAAWTKMIDPAAFARQIETEGLDLVLSAWSVGLLGIGIEVLLGVLLVLGVRRLPVLWAASGLVAFFLFLTGRTWWLASRGELPADVGCGCFGNLVQRTPAEAFWQDLFLLVPALLVAWLARPRAAGPPRWRTGIAVLATAGAVGFAVLAPGLPLDDLATRLSPGRTISELCAGADANRVCLDGVVPELQRGEHFVVIAALDEAFSQSVPALDDYHLSGDEPGLVVLAAVTPEELFAFRFGQGASFEIHEAPEPLLRPLYRTLPRSFRVVDGEVLETWTGLPPAVEASSGPDGN